MAKLYSAAVIAIMIVVSCTAAYSQIGPKAPEPATLKANADSVNPSLWRQAQLNAIHGLFKVTDRVYQVRGFDISNMTPMPP